MKIYYTPYINKDDIGAEFEIPESSFLKPIKLSEETISLVTPSESRNNNANIPSYDKQNKQDKHLSNLTWARKITTHPKVTTDTVSSVINWDELKRRQMMAESSGNAKAISKAGAKGLYQIMDGTHKDYIKATGDDGDIFDPKYNTKIRDWYMNWLSNTDIIKNSSNSDFDKAKNMLIAYNWGIGNLKKYLNGEKELPEETRKYIEKILPNA